MVFVQKTWVANPGVGEPSLDEDELNRIEQGIADVTSGSSTSYDNGGSHSAISAGDTLTITAATHGLGVGQGKLVLVKEISSGDDIQVAYSVNAGTGDVSLYFGPAFGAKTLFIQIVSWA